MEKSSASAGLTGLLLLIFVTLKLSKVIAWSWWWVLSPIWITVILWVLVFVVAVVIANYIARKSEDKENKNLNNK